MAEVNSKPKSLVKIRLMFIWALVFGALGISISPYLNYSELTVLIPLLSMFLYTGFGYSYSINSLFLEPFADSVYYLGFLLTLIALVVSLYFYQGDSLDSGVLVSNFSLALLTTIFGLAVRIFINNFQIDVNGAERHIMSGVELAANELIKKSKLISMQLDVSHQETQAAIRRSVNQATEEIYQTALKVNQQVLANSETLQKNTQAMNQTLTKTVTSFEQNILDIKLPDEIFAKQLNEPINKLVHRLNEAQILFKELNLHQGGISQSAEGIAHSIGNTSIEVDILANSMGLFNNKLNENTQINNDLVKLIKEMSILAKNTLSMSDSLTQQSEKSSLVLNNFSKLAQSSGQMTEVFENIGNSTQAGTKIGNDLQEIAMALANTRETVREISDFGVHVISSFKRLETFNQLIEQHTLLLKNMGEVAQLDIDLAKQHKFEMEAILQQSRDSLSLMQKGLVSSNNNLNS